MKHPHDTRHRHQFLWRTIAFLLRSDSAALVRIGTARGVINSLVYLGISANGRRVLLTLLVVKGTSPSMG